MKKKSQHAKNLEHVIKLKKERVRKPILVPVHISGDEIFYFNYLQGGQSVDPYTGLREYSKLSKLIKIPEIRDIFIKISSIEFSGESLPEDIQEFVNENDPANQGIEIEPIESDYEPEVQELAAHGENGDDYLVMIPDDVVSFLDILQGGKNEAPKDHLQQFFNFGNAFKSVVRAAATVVGGAAGFMVGGPLGAAAGAYAGNALGRGLTGQSLGGKNSLFKAAIPNAFYGGLGGLGASFAGIGAGAAGAAGGGASGAASGALGKAAGAAPIFNGAFSTAPGVTTAATPYVMGAGSSSAAAGAGSSGLLGGIGSSLGGYSVPGSLLGASLLLGNKGQKQKQQEYEQDKREHHDLMDSQNNYIHRPLKGNLYSQPEYRFDASRARERNSGYSDHLSYDRPRRRRSSDDLHNYYKKGGIVTEKQLKGVALRGPGKGQDDLIKKDIPEYTWIHDATTVSNLGDGVTDEGHKEIHAFENKIRREMLPLYKDKIKQAMNGNKLRKVPCAVANGEHETPPLLVAALGEGSFERGGKILRKMTKEIRLHKTSARHNLPPEAHDLDVYYKKIISKRK